MLRQFLFAVLCVTVTHGRSNEELVAGDVSTIFTSDNYTYVNNFIQVLERNYIAFELKACSDAHVAIFDTKTDTEKHLIEIVLGGWENSKSVIRHGKMNGVALTEALTTDILHCGEYRMFWIHWSSSHFVVGRGPRYYEQELMRADRTGDTDFPINYLGVSTGFGHTATWRFPEGMAYHLGVATPNVTPQAFQYVTKSVERRYGFFRFMATACHDLHIAMGPEQHSWPIRVNLCAWSNTEHCVFYGGYPTCANRTNVCECNVAKEYWISWKNNVIRAGQGYRFRENQLVEYTPPVPLTISYLSFSTGWGASGRWVFDEDRANAFDITTTSEGDTPVVSFNTMMVTSKHHFVPFKLMACDNAWICFSKDGTCDYPSAYTLFINRDGRTGFSKGINGDVVIDKDITGILSCNQSVPLWVSYYNGHLHFGLGNDYQYGLLLEYDPPADEDFSVQAMGFGTAHGDGLWSIKKNHGDSIVTQTPPRFHWLNMWMTTRSDLVVYVKIKGTKDAVVFMSEIAGYPDEFAYEVIIGYETSKCLIRQKVGDSYSTIAEQDTGQVLSNDELRTFWISWLDGQIQVGQGYKYGQRPLISSPERVPHVINGVGITGISDTLDWEFEADQGDYFTMRTDTTSFDNHWVHLYPRDEGYWLYFQVSGSSVKLVISQNYMDDSDAYIIYIGADSNTRTRLYKGDSELLSVTTPDILHQDELKTFWVSWLDGKLQFGPSRYRGYGTILDYNVGDFGKSVEGIGLANIGEANTHWRFSTSQGVEEFAFQTNEYEDNQQIWYSLTRHTDMVFQVKACKEAHVWFGSVMFSENWYDSYLIVLQDASDNSFISIPYKTSMGMNRKIAVQVNTPGLLSCTEYRTFWVSWLDGALVFGKGDVHGENIVMSMHDFDALPVRAFSAHSYTERASFKIPTSRNGFARTQAPADDSDSLSGGQITGIVFGFLILALLFVGAIFIILRPPDALRPYLAPPPAGSQGGSGGHSVSSRQLAEQEMKQNPTQAGFDNPLAQEGNTEQGTY